MKFGFKEIEIPMGLFDFKVICIIGDFKNINKYIQWKFKDKDFNNEGSGKFTARGMYFYRTGYFPVIWIPKKPKTPREHATLSHEALHATYRLFSWVGMPINESTEEVATHTTAHIVNSVLSYK